jgi:hypothetical protein
MSELFGPAATLSFVELQARIESLENGLASYSSQLSRIQDNMTGSGWYSSSTDKAEILEQLADILDITPTQTVSITATISISVSHEVPLSELEDFDADMLLCDQLSIDAYGGDTSVDDWSVDSADWEEQ